MAKYIDKDRLQKEFEIVCVGECDCCGRCLYPTTDKSNHHSEGATNGDMIKAMFPNARVSSIFPSFNDDEVYYVPIEKVNGVTNEMRVMKSWWNAPYKKGCENNDSKSKNI